jgi:hypothetical protein
MLLTFMPALYKRQIRIPPSGAPAEEQPMRRAGEDPSRDVPHCKLLFYDHRIEWS